MAINTDPTKAIPIDQFFPELREWFEYLKGGYQAGATWQSLLMAHVCHVGRRRTVVLSTEIRQLQSLELTDDFLEDLICGVLGLAEVIPTNEDETPRGFLIQMNDELTDLLRALR